MFTSSAVQLIPPDQKNRRGEIPGLAKRAKSLGIQWRKNGDMSWEYPIFICGELVNEDHPTYTGWWFQPHIDD